MTRVCKLGYANETALESKMYHCLSPSCLAGDFNLIIIYYSNCQSVSAIILK